MNKKKNRYKMLQIFTDNTYGVEFENIGAPKVQADNAIITFYNSLIVDVPKKAFADINTKLIHKNEISSMNKVEPSESYQIFMGVGLLNKLFTRASHFAKMEFTLFDKDLPLSLDIGTVALFYPGNIS